MSATRSPRPLESVQITVNPLNAITRSLDAEAAADSSAGRSDEAACSKDQLPCFVLLDDVWLGTSHLQDMFEGMQRPLYGVSLPQVCQVFLCFESASIGLRGKTLLLRL